MDGGGTMILNVTVDVSLNAVADPAVVGTRITEALGRAFREVDGVTTFQVVRVMPEDEVPPVEAGDALDPTDPIQEETQEDV